MTHRRGRAVGRRLRDRSWPGGVLGATCLLLAVTACAPTVIQGRAASMLYDPDRVGGLRAESGFSGVRHDAPRPRGHVERTDGGDNDRLALLAVNDIQEFWTATYPQYLAGEDPPVEN